MAFQMIDGDKRFVQSQGQSFGRHDADDDPPDEAGTGRSGNCVDVLQLYAGAFDAEFDYLVNMFKMRTGGNFGNHASESLMFFLRKQTFAQNFALVADNGGGGFVTAAFYS